MHVVICDQGTNNRNFLETLEKVSVERPYFVHNNKTIYAMYDPPHLLKNVRNNLKKGNLHYNNQTVSCNILLNFTTKTNHCQLEWLQN